MAAAGCGRGRGRAQEGFSSPPSPACPGPRHGSQSGQLRGDSGPGRCLSRGHLNHRRRRPRPLPPPSPDVPWPGGHPLLHPSATAVSSHRSDTPTPALPLPDAASPHPKPPAAPPNSFRDRAPKRAPGLPAAPNLLPPQACSPIPARPPLTAGSPPRDPDTPHPPGKPAQPPAPPPPPPPPFPPAQRQPRGAAAAATAGSRAHFRHGAGPRWRPLATWRARATPAAAPRAAPQRAGGPRPPRRRGRG
ncbi:uncharacterized protein [Aphelocoma coerulescens]|uniref:uncharacterized protein n=1 Tax=Aphelocoma coerulescens TaxID=39617 RepID=UPI0036051F49